VRDYRSFAEAQAAVARERQQLVEAKRMLVEAGSAGEELGPLIAAREQALDERCHKLLEIWPQVRESYAGEEYVVKIRDREVRTGLVTSSLSGTPVRKVALPRFEDHGDLLRWLLLENLPGSFPYTAGVFAFKRESEDPTRMFAGEGDPSASSPSSARARTRRACSPARAIPSAPTSASRCCRRIPRRRGCPPPSIR
jgi:methylmalonyl-CoA mutase